MKVYYLGGSPCSGKSTVAEMISRRFGFYYYKLDDNLDEHMMKAAHADKPLCKAYMNRLPDDIWMREPKHQFEDEVGIYKELFEYSLADLKKINVSTPIITEGAGFLPELMKEAGVSADEYACIIPTKEFQIDKYSKREWVSFILEGCSDKKKAFENWMERDVLYAQYVVKTAEEAGYQTIITDGLTDSGKLLEQVESIFEF